VKAFPNSNPRYLSLGFEAIPPSIHTTHSQGKPIGWMAEQDWQETIDLLTRYSDLKSNRAPKEYFTNDFAPAS
jgi:NitT/TauT family transport system substrate-binding protein